PPAANPGARTAPTPPSTSGASPTGSTPPSSDPRTNSPVGAAIAAMLLAENIAAIAAPTCIRVEHRWSAASSGATLIYMRQHHSSDLRRGRFSEQGRVYLVTFTTQGRQRHVEQWQLAHAAARSLGALESWGDSRLLCWVLMPDHWHGLLGLGESANLSRTAGRAKASATRDVRVAVGMRVSVWSRHIHNRGMRKDEDMRTAARYIGANPLRAGLVERVADY